MIFRGLQRGNRTTSSSSRPLQYTWSRTQFFHRICVFPKDQVYRRGLEFKFPGFTVSGGCATIGLASFSVFRRLSTKSDFSLLCVRAQHVVVSKSVRSFSTHVHDVVDCVSVTKPVGFFDSIIHMPLPIIFRHHQQPPAPMTSASNSCSIAGIFPRTKT